MVRSEACDGESFYIGKVFHWAARAIKVGSCRVSRMEEVWELLRPWAEPKREKPPLVLKCITSSQRVFKSCFCKEDIDNKNIFSVQTDPDPK